jgi:hypothetical protein
MCGVIYTVCKAAARREMPPALHFVPAYGAFVEAALDFFAEKPVDVGLFGLKFRPVAVNDLRRLPAALDAPAIGYKLEINVFNVKAVILFDIYSVRFIIAPTLTVWAER